MEEEWGQSRGKVEGCQGKRMRPTLELRELGKREGQDPDGQLQWMKSMNHQSCPSQQGKVKEQPAQILDRPQPSLSPRLFSACDRLTHKKCVAQAAGVSKNGIIHGNAVTLDIKTDIPFLCWLVEPVWANGAQSKSCRHYQSPCIILPGGS